MRLNMYPKDHSYETYIQSHRKEIGSFQRDIPI